MGAMAPIPLPGLYLALGMDALDFLYALDILDILDDIFEHEEYSEDIHHYRKFLGFAREHLDQHVGQQSQHDTFGNGVGEGHHHHGDEARYNLCEVGHLDVLHGLHHHYSYDHQSTGSGSSRDKEEDG